MVRSAARWVIAALAVVLPVGGASWAEGEDPADARGGGARSPRNADYTIEVSLDPVEKTLTGRQILRWRNLQESETGELWFHLYWNAWRNNQSSWMREDRIRARSRLTSEIAEEDWGWLEVDSIVLLPGDEQPDADLSRRWRYVSPDDGNPEDRTVMVVDLPRTVAPGEEVAVELRWHAKIPRTFARTGYRGDFFFIAHWFPKVGVFEPGGWNCHQYHAATEYYSDYGVYDVSITLPGEFVLGATGRETGSSEREDGTVTHRYIQEDVHAFTWTASPDFLDLEERFEEEGLPAVDMRLLLQPEHRSQAARHFEATRAALKHYGTWFGPYPYGHLTVVDPAFGSDAGGMEYPTLFTAGTRLFNPFGGGSPEGVTIHEAGHQFWYALVGNNEFEHAWIDEGLNTFSTARTFEEHFGERFFVRRYFSPPGTDLEGFFPLLDRDIRRSRTSQSRRDRYRRAATWDVPATPTYRYYPAAASAISYTKTALWLFTLERYLGWETLQRILSTFFERWRFRHPGPEDFFSIADEISGEDLGWYFDQVFRSARRFDYAVESVASLPVGTEGMVEREGGLSYLPPVDEETRESNLEASLYRTEVVVRRLEGGIFPVEVLMVFEDGSELRRSWEGRDRWTLLEETRPSRLRYAVVDPERILMLDTDFTNNSRLLEPEATLPAVKWASRWMIWLQDLLAAYSFFS